ncbi:hotdog domain-containing protein [Shigella boydii]|nr:hypothetical protein SDB_00959 [Shigella dysenteriae CDC 74-1112]EIQ64674.1 thioesterase family protein [Shigella dysenteriae 225-75]
MLTRVKYPTLASICLTESHTALHINYRRPAVLSDLLTITSQLQQLNGKSGILSQVITLEPEGQVVADALITFVCIDLKTQKALALEGELREKLEQMVK